MKRPFLCVLLAIVPWFVQAEERLMVRSTLLSSDAQCAFQARTNWNSVLLPNDGHLLVTRTQGEWVEYPLPLTNFAGNVELLVYKYHCDLPFDDQVKLEVYHNSVLDSSTVDLSTAIDGWYSLGKYHFSGAGHERVRFARATGQGSGLTPAPMVRFDAYYDLLTREQTVAEQNAPVPPGYSESGTWQVTTRPGYRPEAAPRQSLAAGASATWNPGPLPAGRLGLYARLPNLQANDRYEIFHQGKVETVYLKNLRFSNLDLYNPVTKLGWFKLGEFEFAGRGKEYVKLTRTTGSVASLADALYFESVKFDGTLLHRTVVLPQPEGGALAPAAASLTLEQKEQATKLPVGFSPQQNVRTSAKFGSTIYSRALWLTAADAVSYWNPCLVEPGDYEVLYYLYWPPAREGRFEIVHHNLTNTVALTRDKFGKEQFVSLGTFHFAGGAADEYIRMSGMDRASDILLEKKTANAAIHKQMLVTAHPYFQQLVYRDTKGHPAEQAISFMVLKGYLTPRGPDQFAPDQPMAVDDFLKALRQMLAPSLASSNHFDLLQGIPASAAATLTRSLAAQLLATAGELSGRYLNVANLFQSDPERVLAGYRDAASVPPWARQAMARLLEAEVLPPSKAGLLQPDARVSRAEGTVLLKNFLEQVLSSGPPALADWTLTFREEFNGQQVDWSRWRPEAQVRFPGLSAKWGENCIVEDGVLKAYNYQDNRGAPYSSGCLLSRFSQVHGFFEARYKYPDRAYGSHSSFWTSSSGGDFNFNEGTYPNGVCPNNYFMGNQLVPGLNQNQPVRACYFTTPTSLAHDFHTYSGFLDERDMFYGFDGQVMLEVKDYPRLYARPTSTTHVPYALRLSTVITYFDGPLDRDRIDGSFMAVDWVRAYQKTNWLPTLVLERSLPADGATGQPLDLAPILKFNKPLQGDCVLVRNIAVRREDGGEVPPYTVTQVTPVRLKLTFSRKLALGAKYSITAGPGITDLRGHHLQAPGVLTFQTTTTSIQ